MYSHDNQYTVDQAMKDGILYDIRTNHPEQKGLFSHITTNLLSLDCRNDDGTINLPNLTDLLNQVQQILQQHSNTKLPRLHDGEILTPSGHRELVLIIRNEIGLYTLMLPHDYTSFSRH